MELYYFILHSHFYTKPQIFPVQVGWGNGYVLIPKDHSLYGKDYDKVQDIYAHGGLTFAAKYEGWDILKKYEDEGYEFQMDEKLTKRVDKEGYDFLKEYWVLGFDTAHFNDNLTTCPKSYVLNEAKELHKQCVQKDIKLQRKKKIDKITFNKKIGG